MISFLSTEKSWVSITYLRTCSDGCLYNQAQFMDCHWECPKRVNLNLCAPPIDFWRPPPQRNNHSVQKRKAFFYKIWKKLLFLVSSWFERWSLNDETSISPTSSEFQTEINCEQIIVKVHGVLSSRAKKPASSRACQVHQCPRRDSEAIVTSLMRDTNYMPRNFATLGLSGLQPPFTGI